MWKDVSVVRTASGLREAEKGIQNVRTALRPRRPEKLKEWLELRNLLTTAQAVTDAALNRKQSLGAHCRINEPTD